MKTQVIAPVFSPQEEEFKEDLIFCDLTKLFTNCNFPSNESRPEENALQGRVTPFPPKLDIAELEKPFSASYTIREK